MQIARVDGVLSLPARFMLLAAFNPCPCGWFGVSGHDCRCEDGARRRYQARLSGPMWDRLDLLAHLAPHGDGARAADSTETVAGRVAEAWRRQQARQGRPNADLGPDAMDAAHGFGPTLDLLESRRRELGLSLRRIHRAARVARTIADLEGGDEVTSAHVDEALVHRPKEVTA